MADNYRAEIRIWPWPEDHAEVQAVADWLTNFYGEIHAEEGGGQLGTPVVSRDGELSVEIEEARYGIEEFLEAGSDPTKEPSLVGLIREAGLSFVVRDEGKYEFEGREISWRPGLEEVRERAVLAGGAVAFPQRLAGRLLAGAAGATAGERLRNYFAPLDAYVEEGLDGGAAIAGEAVVCEGESGAPSVLYASEDVEVVVIPAYREEERDVYGPRDVLETIKEIESLRGFAASDVLRGLVAELRETAGSYEDRVPQRNAGGTQTGSAESRKGAP